MEIISAIIEGVCKILAAVIGAGWIGKKVVEQVGSYFTTYSDKEHNLEPLIENSEKSITIVVSYGENLLNRYYKIIEEYLNKNDKKVRFVMQKTERAVEMDKEFYGIKKKDVEAKIKNVLKQLKELNGAGALEVREYDGLLTASYIAIDIDIDKKHKADWEKDSVIQIMLYQNGIDTQNAAINCIYPNKDSVHFHNTVNSIHKIWQESKAVTL